MKLESKRAMVIGASSGIGAALVEELVCQGYMVAAVARRKEALENLCREVATPSAKALPYAFDVTRFSEVPKVFDQIVTDLKGLEIVVFAAGVMPEMAKDEYNFAKDQDIINTNLLAAMAWCNEAAQFFSRTEQGTLVGISSVAGDRGRRGNPAYCTSKAALNTYLESLRNRLDPFGVQVLTVKPGFVDTAMTRGKPGVFWAISAREAARRILESVKKRKQLVYIPCRWRFVMWVIRNIPSFLFRKLDI